MKLYSLVAISVVLICTVKAIDEPPRITSTFLDNYYIPEENEEEQVWTCTASGNPPPEYQWKKDGITIVPSQNVNFDKRTGVLRILKAHIQHDFGKYQCFANNRAGIAMSVAFELKRTFIGVFSDIVQKDLPAVDQYRNVSLKCSGKPKCVPGNKCQIEWKRGLGVKDSVQENKRIAIDKEGTLHFLYVKLEDESTSNLPYSCVLGNEEMKAYYKGANIVMPVRQVGNPTGYRPILLFKQDTRGLIGGEAELQCVFASYPLPDISWKRPGGKPIDIGNPGKYEFRDNLIRRTLKIKKLTIEDEGEYSCVGENEHGSGNAKLFLNVTSKPYFKQGEILKSVVSPSGRDATFTCKMYSLDLERPPTAPMWFKNGQLLPASQIGPNPRQKYQLSADKSVLTVKNVQEPGDSSSILCKAGNVIYDANGDDMYSETYSDATLRVIDPIAVNVLSNMKKELTSNQPFSLAFTATTDESIPQLFYKWNLIQNNKTVIDLQNQPFVVFNADKTNLTIYPERANSDGEENQVGAVVGLYQVRIYHDYDTVTKTFDIYTNMVVATTAPIVTSAGFDLWIIGVILGIIVLIIVVFFIVCTLYRNRGGEYLVDKKEVAAGHDPKKELINSGFTDLSRADDEKTPFDKASLTDEVKPLESDEDSMMGDYADEANTSKFNEDGSFLGVYMDGKGQGLDKNQSMV